MKTTDQLQVGDFVYLMKYKASNNSPFVEITKIEKYQLCVICYLINNDQIKFKMHEFVDTKDTYSINRSTAVIALYDRLRIIHEAIGK
jgi:hypothetical protein